MYERLIYAVKTLSPVPDDQIEIFIKMGTQREFNINETFISAGEIPTKLAFNLKGLFRYYYPCENGNEYTKGFFPENTFISSYSAMIQNRGSYFTIEALEKSTALVLDYLDWKRLFNEHPSWGSFIIALLEMGYMTKESRERELLLFDAETRYRLFLERFPGLDRRVKQHYIASYLGITPVALSRVRKKMGIIHPPIIE